MIGIDEHRPGRRFHRDRRHAPWPNPMKLLWCWRCKTEVPMLDDDEFKHALSLKGTGTGDLWNGQFGPVLREYERITGFQEADLRRNRPSQTVSFENWAPYVMSWSPSAIKCSEVLIGLFGRRYASTAVSSTSATPIKHRSTSGTILIVPPFSVTLSVVKPTVLTGFPADTRAGSTTGMSIR